MTIGKARRGWLHRASAPILGRMIFSYPYIIVLLIQYKYILLLPIMVMEGPIIAVIGGLLASLGYMDIRLVFLLSLAGDLLGDAAYYTIGRWARSRFVEPLGRFVGLTPERMNEAEHYFEHHAAVTLITAKLTHAAGIFVLVAAGSARMPFWEFLILNFIASIPKSALFVAIGYYFGNLYPEINNFIGEFSIIVVCLMALVGLALALRHARRKSRIL